MSRNAVRRTRVPFQITIRPLANVRKSRESPAAAIEVIEPSPEAKAWSRTSEMAPAVVGFGIAAAPAVRAAASTAAAAPIAPAVPKPAPGAKILVVDVWRLNPRDRYLTFIVLGAALLLVSFLYTRNREALRQYL